MATFRSPLRIARRSPCCVFASPWTPSTRHLWRVYRSNVSLSQPFNLRLLPRFRASYPSTILITLFFMLDGRQWAFTGDMPGIGQFCRRIVPSMGLFGWGTMEPFTTRTTDGLVFSIKFKAGNGNRSLASDLLFGGNYCIKEKDWGQFVPHDNLPSKSLTRLLKWGSSCIFFSRQKAIRDENRDIHLIFLLSFSFILPLQEPSTYLHIILHSDAETFQKQSRPQLRNEMIIHAFLHSRFLCCFPFLIQNSTFCIQNSGQRPA